MGSRMFNGSTFSFNGAPVARLVGMSYKLGGQWVDVSQPEDLNKLYELGQTDIEVALKFKGHCWLAFKTKGTAAIIWSDGATSSCPGTWQVGPVNPDGNWDAPITDSCTLRPTVPD